MIKSLKQYLSLRGLLARRLRAKKKEIERIKAKNRFYSCPYGVFDLSKVYGMSNYITHENERILDFLSEYSGYYVYRLRFNNTDDSKEITMAIIGAVSQQLKQLKGYD